MTEQLKEHSISHELLSHLRVLDISTAEAYDCGRIFAYMGAEVIRLDRVSPLDDKAWKFGNEGKQSVVLDYFGAGRDAFLALVKQSDILIESYLPGTLAAHELSYEALADINPGLILVSISGFGQTGPYASFKGRELVVAALSGSINAMGEVDDHPVKEPGHANFFHASSAGVAGALLAERIREQTGRGQWVDISAQEMGAGRGTVQIIKHQFGDEVPGRSGQAINMGAGANRVLWPVADGEVFYMEARPGTPMAADMDAWIKEATGVAPDPSHDHATVEKFFASMTSEQAIREAKNRRIRVMSVYGPDDVISDEQLNAREFYVEREGVRMPGHYIKVYGE